MSAPLPPLIRDGPSEKLWKERERGQVVEGGGAFRSTPPKKNSYMGFVNEKNYARRRALEIYVSALALKNILAREILTEKKFPTPSPQLFSNGRSLCWVTKKFDPPRPSFFKLIVNILCCIPPIRCLRVFIVKDNSQK